MSQASEFEVEVERLAAGGDGVAHLPDGRVLFVPRAAPGDRLRVRLVEERARFARGEVEAVLRAGPDRREPFCPAFGSCGGCAWQHLSEAAQLDAKREILRDALVRIAHLEAPAEIPMTPSPEARAYRIRARVLSRDGAVGYRAHASHSLCAVKTCPVLVPSLERELAELAHHPAASGPEKEWELVAGRRSETRVTRLPARSGGSSESSLQIEVAGFALRISPGVFVQANAFLQESLASAVVEAATAEGPADREHGDSFLELHAGAGALTLPLAAHFAAGVAVEAHPDAVRDLAANLATAGIDHVRALRARAEDHLRKQVKNDRPPGVVILDPPRTGLAAGGAEALAAFGAPRIVYLSCDPATLARDLAKLVDAGYALRSLRGFDLFPQTPHVEGLAVLERAL